MMEKRPGSSWEGLKKALSFGKSPNIPDVATKKIVGGKHGRIHRARPIFKKNTYSFPKEDASSKGEEDFATLGIPKTQARELYNMSTTRISFEELERLYAVDPIVQSGVNIYAATIREVIQPYMIRCSPECRNKMASDLLASYYFKDVIDKMVRHLCIYGNSLVFPSPSPNKVQAFFAGDPRLYDFINDSGVVVTSNGILPKGFKIWTSNINVDPAMLQKEYLADKDVYFCNLNQLHYTDWGWGYVELMYDQIQQRRNLADGRTNRTKREGVGVPIVFYGTDKFPPSPKLKMQAKQIRDDVDDPNTVAMTCPATIKISSIDKELGYSESSTSLETEAYLNSLSAGVLGIPLAVLLMTSNKADTGQTLNNLLPFFEWNVKYIGDRLRLDDLLTAWAHSNGFPDEKVQVFWGDLLPSTVKETSMRLFRMGKAGMIPNNATMNTYMAQVLKMPTDLIQAIESAPILMPEVGKSSAGRPPSKASPADEGE